MKTKTIKELVIIKSSPQNIYEAFMNEKKHQEFTGYKAKIDNRIGGKFITCGQRNFGYTLFLKQGERIVQAWAHKNFPRNQYSIIDIRLETSKNGYTKLAFHQLGAPIECIEWLIPGWTFTYWAPLKEYLERGIVKSLGV